AADVQDAKPKRVLVILDRADLPWLNILTQSLQAALQSTSPYPVDLHIEYTDQGRYPDDIHRQKLTELYRLKYVDVPMDLVIGVGDEAADLLVEYGVRLFGEIPMIIISANPKTLQRDFLKPNMTSLLWGVDIQGNVTLIEELMPNTRRLFIVSGSSLSDREVQKLAQTGLREYQGPLEINYIDDDSQAALLEKVAQLPENAALLYLVFNRDAKGAAFVSREMLSAISAKANAPVFGILETYLGFGIVGGRLLSAEVQGRRCAEVAARIMSGVSPKDVHPERVLNHLMFDWHQLKRWKIPEDRLPPGSIIRFKTPAFWDLYRWYVITAIFIVLVQGGLISFLLRQRTLRYHAQADLAERLRFEKTLSELSARFVNLPPDRVDSQIAHELKMLAKFFEVDRVTVFEISEIDQRLHTVHSFTRSNVAPAPSQIEFHRLTWAQKKLFNGEMVIFSDPGELPPDAVAEKEFLQSQGVRSAVVVPLKAEQSTLGLLTLTMLRRPKEWQRDLTPRLGLVAEVFANALARKRHQIALLQSKKFNRSILDSLNYQIAVLDLGGNILDVNESWRKFARQNDAKSLDRIGTGLNYIDVCRESACAGDTLAQTALEGIQSVLDGKREQFMLDYPCDSPVEERWFSMRVIPFSGRKGGAIVSHIDITDRKLAESDLRKAYTKIEGLKKQLEAEAAYLQDEIKLEHNFESIIGTSAAIKYVLYKVEQVAATDTSVLILGETGTGKELMARAIHSLSLHNARPLVKVDFASLPASLIESELFGHERGAFTGAQTQRIGRFEVANGTTIFLDEIGELPLELQPKLLRVLQDGEFERLGSTRTIKVDVRVIAATNRDLEAEVREGLFREDLFYRLNVFPISVPPLRDRPEDIPLFVRFFVEKVSKGMGRSIVQIPHSIIKTMQDYPWPGNVRELQNVIERAVISSSGPSLRLADELTVSTPKAMPNHLRTLQDIEIDHITRVLEETGWRIEGPKGAAVILDINPSTLRTRMRKLGIKKP
ncbi:MAG: sigma 54-interacting transcriptional regulator, partial [Desulfobacterales bacterium]